MRRHYFRIRKWVLSEYGSCQCLELDLPSLSHKFLMYISYGTMLQRPEGSKATWELGRTQTMGNKNLLDLGLGVLGRNCK